jgi:hypothetical protein
MDYVVRPVAVARLPCGPSGIEPSEARGRRAAVTLEIEEDLAGEEEPEPASS